MQEEVEQRIVSLMISCGKLGEQEFRKAVAKLLEQLKSGHQKHQYSKANPHGKMTVKQLAAKDKGLQSIEVTDQNIGSFNRIARKYGIDFAPFKVKGEKRTALPAGFRRADYLLRKERHHPPCAGVSDQPDGTSDAGCAGTWQAARRELCHEKLHS